MVDDAVSKDAGRAGAWQAAEAIVGALAIAAYANLAIALALGGYESRVLRLHLRVHDLGVPLIVAAALLLARWLVSIPSTGFSRSARSFMPWGPVGVIAGVFAFVAVALRQPVAVRTFQAVVVCALAAAGFIFAWLAYGRGRSSAVRLVVLVGFLASSMALAESLPKAKLWSKTFHRPPKKYRPGLEVAPERNGILVADGLGVIVAKEAVGNDWRDAMVLTAPGECSVPVDAPSGAKLVFSVAVKRARAPSTVTITFVGEHDRGAAAWEATSSSLPSDKWLDVSVPLGAAGRGRVVYSIEGASGADSVIIANPRIPTGVTARPNVLLVVIDALRPDRLGVYGYSRPTSKEIDTLSSDAVVFDNAVAQAPWTVPSIAGIFTSLYPSAHGAQVYNSILSDSIDTITKSLRREGYYAGCIQTNPLLEPEMGLAEGFNDYSFLGAVGWKGVDKAGFSSASIVTDAAIDWIGKREGSPFFLYLHYMDCHRPFARIAGFDAFGSDASSMYDGEITLVSAQFARLMEFLRSRSLREKTLVIFTADHGEQFMERGRDGHASDLHVEELRVPLIIWPPEGGRQRPVRIKSLVRSIDIPPTILETAGAQPLAAAEGQSLRAAFTGRELPGRIAWSELTTQRPYGEFLVGLTTDKYRYIFSNPDVPFANRIEAFDLAADKAEIVNLTTTRPDLVAEIKAATSAYLATERSIHRKLVPEDASIPLTPERLEQLKALGYMAPGK